MATSYIVILDPVTNNNEIVVDIVREATGSQQQAADLLQSGSVVRETDDKDEAEELATRLEAEGADVEIEYVVRLNLGSVYWSIMLRTAIGVLGVLAALFPG